MARDLDEDDVRVRPGRGSRPRSKVRPSYRSAKPAVVAGVDRGRFACELDDGTILTESVAICRYFEELHPEPPLFGTTTLERAQIEMCGRW